MSSDLSYKSERLFFFGARKQSCKSVENFSFCLSFSTLWWKKSFYQHVENLKGTAFLEEQVLSCSKDCYTINNWQPDIIIRLFWYSDYTDPCSLYYAHIMLLLGDQAGHIYFSGGKLTERYRRLVRDLRTRVWWIQDSKIHFLFR